MSRPPLSPRSDLVEVEPYASPQHPARYRLNTNESPFPPPQYLVEEVASALRSLEFNRYPKEDASGLFDALAEFAGWSSDGLWVANGSNEVLLHLFLAFGGPGRSVFAFEPTYSLHSLLPRIAGTRIRALWRDENFTIDLEDALGAIEKEDPEIVMVCSPNNPTGNCEPLTNVRALLEATRGIVVVDEAYGEFSESVDSARPLLDDYRNLVLVKTFSKAWSLAGVRIGYMLCDPTLLEGIRRVRLPYHLSSLTQLVGEVALRHAGDTLKIVEAIKEERDRTAVELQAMGIKTYHSRANFVMFEVDDGDAVYEGLLRRGVLVRNYSSTPGLRNRLRVTAGLAEETDAFLGAIKEVLDEQ